VAEPIPSSAEGILTRYVYRKAKDGSLLQASLKTEHFYLTETVEILNNLPLVRKIALYHYPTLFPATKEMPPLTEKQKIFLEPLLTGKKSLLPPERGLPGISKNLSRNFSRAGELIVSIPENSPYAAFSDKSLRVMEAFGNVLAAFFGMDGFIKSQELFQKELLMTITGILETHDAYTQGHSESVALLGGQIARALDLPERQVQQTYWAGLVHDIGKILIPKEILNKPSSLTPEEYALIQEHPALGYAMLNKAERLQEIAPFVLHHHERWDGKGYPQGLGKEEIPEISRILAVADTWDAMTSNRSYRQALPEDVARKEILRGKGTQFDPRMVDLFFSVLGDFPKKA
jgi:HD-GYP domain-containing protein (c-di-GMP phosphodiesterase class II)